MTFRIVWAKRKDGKWGWRVHVEDGNHKLIFWTQVYKIKASAEHAIALMRAKAATARIVDDTTA
jgi:uncharacterized protein YegP (UPF0339 family)